MRMVIALGGNALLPKGARGTAKEQEAAARKALRKLAGLFRGRQIALTHGNGPQVGSLLLQQQATRAVPGMPLDVLDAMTEGEIGYFIQSSLPRRSAAILTRVVVDEHDPAFNHPTKPIGPFYKKRGEGMVMDAGRGYRLVVPSPMPVDIMEKDAILALLERGFIVVCGGGGGIPVRKDGAGLRAVIDKDNFSSLLATLVGADTLVFVTSVKAACTDFGKRSQKEIRKASAAEMERLLSGGHFAEGSMKPKVSAALRFLDKGGRKAVICSIGTVSEALAGKAGTTISRH